MRFQDLGDHLIHSTIASVLVLVLWATDVWRVQFGLLVLTCSDWRAGSVIVSQLFQQCLQGSSHLIAVSIATILVVVALWRHDLAVVVRLGAAVLDEDDGQGHLRLVLLLPTDVLESAVSALVVLVVHHVWL